jgi:hypothetical protein
MRPPPVRELGVSLPLPEDRNGFSYRNVVFYSHLEVRTTGKVQNPSNSEH